MLFVLDAFQSNIFDGLMNTEPAYGKTFERFSYYSDAAAGAKIYFN